MANAGDGEPAPTSVAQERFARQVLWRSLAVFVGGDYY